LGGAAATAKPGLTTTISTKDQVVVLLAHCSHADYVIVEVDVTANPDWLT
jgi:hypothetical protein